MKNKTPIAIAVYLDDSGDIYRTELYTEEEILDVINSEHDDVGDYKAIIVRGDNLSVIDAT